MHTLFNVAHAIIVTGIPLLIPKPYYYNFITEGINIEGAVAELIAPNARANKIGMSNNHNQEIRVTANNSQAIGATKIQSTTTP